MKPNTHSKTSPSKPPGFANRFLLLAGLLVMAGTAGTAAAWEVRQLTSDGGIKSGLCAQNGSVLWTRVDGSRSEL
jgi:hypothetical protein